MARLGSGVSAICIINSVDYERLADRQQDEKERDEKKYVVESKVCDWRQDV